MPREHTACPWGGGAPFGTVVSSSRRERERESGTGRGFVLQASRTGSRGRERLGGALGGHGQRPPVVVCWRFRSKWPSPVSSVRCSSAAGGEGSCAWAHRDLFLCMCVCACVRVCICARREGGGISGVWLCLWEPGPILMIPRRGKKSKIFHPCYRSIVYPFSLVSFLRHKCLSHPVRQKKGHKIR